MALARERSPLSTKANTDCSAANISLQCTQMLTCAPTSVGRAAPLAAASISAPLYLSHSIATSPPISFCPRILATSLCRSASPTSLQLLPACALPWPRGAAPTLVFPATPPGPGQTALGIRRMLPVLLPSAAQDASLVGPIPFRPARAASPSGHGPRLAETRCAPAIRENAVHRASD